MSTPLSHQSFPRLGDRDHSPLGSLDLGPPECRSPAAPPWLKYDDCVFFYETRTIQQAGVQVRVLYEHCLKLLGRQQGSLLYTLTLLPGETIKIYQYERYRRSTEKTDYFSVRAALTSEVLETHRRQSEERTGVSQNLGVGITGGGGSVGIVKRNAPVDLPFDLIVTIQNPVTTLDNRLSANIANVSSEFTETVQRTSTALEADRSIVVSTFEETEAGKVTERTLSNPNRCYAVTYFIRRVNEVYSLSTKATGITWRRFGVTGDYSPWQLVGELVNASEGEKEFIEKLLPQLPVTGQVTEVELPITLPTDGAVYEAELAHCSSCDPEHRTEVLIELEAALCNARRACARADILELEAERRRRLLAANQLEPFNSVPTP